MILPLRARSCAPFASFLPLRKPSCGDLEGCSLGRCPAAHQRAEGPERHEAMIRLIGRALEKPEATAGGSTRRKSEMKAVQLTAGIAAGMCAVTISTALYAQDPPWRHEIRRLDVPGAPDKQIVVELNEFKPGDGLDRHSHPGIEQGYVI